MRLPVIIQREAEQRIVESAQWWGEHHSAEQAIRWYAGILDAIDTLTDNPQRCPLARENAASPCELRELHYGLGSRPTHRVLFTIRPDAVVVLSVRHGAQQDVTPEDL
jgi:plasmid stabilization system protein ParE